MLDVRRVHELIDSPPEAAPLGPLSWEGGFGEYLSLVLESPAVLRDSLRRLRDAVAWASSVPAAGKDGPGGLDGRDRDWLSRVHDELDLAARRPGRGLALVIVEGTSAERAERGVAILGDILHRYSQENEGALFSYRWCRAGGEDPSLPGSVAESEVTDCPVHEEPVALIPAESRRRLIGDGVFGGDVAYSLGLEGPLCPACAGIQARLLREFHGDWARMIERVRVHRLVLPDASAGSGDTADAVALDPAAGGDPLPLLRGASRGVLNVTRLLPRILEIVGTCHPSPETPAAPRPESGGETAGPSDSQGPGESAAPAAPRVEPNPSGGAPGGSGELAGLDLVLLAAVDAQASVRAPLGESSLRARVVRSRVE